jgi:hypothetical protein
MINSVINEGARALQSSQKDLARAAADIARSSERNEAVRPETNIGSASFNPVEESVETAAPGGFAEPIVELKRQELLFNAAAEVVSTGDQVLGSLLDIDA